MPRVITDVCLGIDACGVCFDECPQGAIKEDETATYPLVDAPLCNDCGECDEVCPVNAIELEEGESFS